MIQQGIRPQGMAVVRHRLAKQQLLLAGFIWIAAAVPAIAQEQATVLLPALPQEQTAAPPLNLQSIQQRLEQQEAEIQWLRSQLSELHTPTAAPLPGPAESVTPAAPQPMAPSEAADTELEELKKRLTALEEAQSKSKVAKSIDDGWIDISNERWSVKLGGHVQIAYITWANADPAIAGAENYLSFRRLRLSAEGTGYGQFDFRLQMTLEPGQGSHESQYASPEVKDAYVSMNEIPVIGRFRIGNFFVPFGLEQVTNDTNNIFNERSIPTQNIFTGDREVGVAFYNHTPDLNMTWAGGLFVDDMNDTIKTRFGDRQGYRVSGRLTWLPYYDEPSDGRYLVHTGVGVLYTHDYDEIARFRARPQVQRGPILIDSGNLPSSDYTTGNVEFAVVWGPVTLQSEAYLCGVDLLSGDTITVGGAYAHVSYFLTGENRIYERFGQHGAQFGRSRPFTNFFLTRGGFGWGAWETKARWSYLDIANTGHGVYNDMTFGFNWYWTDRMRIMFDWIHPVTNAQTVFGAINSDLIAMRYDVNW